MDISERRCDSSRCSSNKDKIPLCVSVIPTDTIRPLFSNPPLLLNTFTDSWLLEWFIYCFPFLWACKDREGAWWLHSVDSEPPVRLRVKLLLYYKCCVEGSTVSLPQKQTRNLMGTSWSQTPILLTVGGEWEGSRGDLSILYLAQSTALKCWSAYSLLFSAHSPTSPPVFQVQTLQLVRK